MRIAIASGKGGTGKTTLAVNLALRAAESHRVCLVDLDVEEPNSGLFIQAELLHSQPMYRQVPVWDQSLCTLCGKCNGVCSFNAVLKLGSSIMLLPELCHSCYACSELCPAGALPMRPHLLGTLNHYHHDNLDFVESKLEIGVEMASPLIRQTLDYVSEHLEPPRYHFLDCPPGTSCSVINATKDADFVILVTEPTPFGLHDLSLAVQTMQELHKPMGVVINRYGIGNDEVIRYCQSLQIPVLALLPNRREIATLYSSGKIIYPHVMEIQEGLDALLSELDKLREAL